MLGLGKLFKALARLTDKEEKKKQEFAKMKEESHEKSVKYANEMLQDRYTDKQVESQEYQIGKLNSKIERVELRIENAKNNITSFEFEAWNEMKKEIHILQEERVFMNMQLTYMKKFPYTNKSISETIAEK